MRKRSTIARCILGSFILMLGGPAAATPSGWWNSNWQYSQWIRITSGAAALPSGFTVPVTFDHAALVLGGKSRSDGNDLRVAYWNGASWNELDRLLDPGSSWNSATTTIWLKLQAGVPASSFDDNYGLYYGNSGAGAPPANGSNVFLHFDGFESGDLSGWGSVWQDPGDVIGATTAAVHGGAYAGQASINATDPGLAAVRAEYAAQPGVHTVFYAYFPAGYAFNADTTIDQLYGGFWGEQQLALVVQGAGGQLYLWNNFMGEPYFGVTTVSTGQWYRLEVKSIVSPTLGRAELWVNGVREANEFNRNTGSVDTDNHLIGTFWKNSGPNTLYVDDAFTRIWIDPEPVTSLGTENSFSSDLLLSPGSGSFTVTVPGYFEMTFDTRAGGGIRRFFDLAEDPSRTYDLAGALEGIGQPEGLFSTGMNVGGTYFNASANNNGSKLDLLEATPTRVRVRQEAFYQNVAGPILGGVKAIGDYSVHPSGRLALRWDRRTTSTVAYTTEYHETLLHHLASGPLSAWTPYSETDGIAPNPGTDDFLLVQNDQPGVRTDFLDILYQDWPMADVTNWAVNLPQERINLAWIDSTASVLPANARDTWSFLAYFKPTNFVDPADPAVLSRANDYRAPDPLTFFSGAAWMDADENTGAGDNFNEAEAAYLLELDPSTGLIFDLDGTLAQPRFSPFFKIRQWRSLQEPATITVEGVTKTNDADYTADVKPISRAHFASNLWWHSTLEDPAAVATPDVGGGGGVSGSTTFTGGKYGAGILIDANGDYATSDSGSFNAGMGTVEFWYQPSFGHTDGQRHVLWMNQSVGPDYFVFEKTAANELLFTTQNTGGGGLASVRIASADFSWRANDWVHLRTVWNATAPAGERLRVFVNGVEPAHVDMGLYSSIGMNSGNTFYGSCGGGICPFGPMANANGIIDEIHQYGDGGTMPIANGGLVSDANEYLADTAKNFQLGFTPLAAGRRGAYLYLGADSKFRGLNVVLATAGTGVAAGALEWQYWNGTGWASLEAVAGFNDQTSSLTQANGTIFWSSDPGGWSAYSVSGGPDLFYLRTYLTLGSYATAPVEALIKTDILLFQYQGDVTASARTFDFTLPMPPLEVSISSATNQSFTVGAATPVLAAAMTITDVLGGFITSANDIRIRIPAGLPLRWDTSLGSASLSGSAAAKVNPAIKAFEDFDQTLVLDVVTNFAPGDQLVVSDLQFFGFLHPAPADSLELEIGDDGSAAAIDDKAIEVLAAGTPSLSSYHHQLFTVLQPPTSAETLYVTEGVAGGSITAAGEFAIEIPPSFPMEWDAIGSVSLSGPAASKVSPIVTYLTVRIVRFDVTAAFSPGEYVAISGLGFKNFSAPSAVDHLRLAVPPGNSVDQDDKIIRIEVSTDVPFFTATATDSRVKLEWINPSFGSCAFLHLLRREDDFPTDPLDPLALPVLSPYACVAGNKESFDDTTSLLNDTTYHYSIFVESSGGFTTPGKRVKARPFDTSGSVKWAYSTGATAMAPPGLRFHSGSAYVYAVSNDNILHAVRGGAGGGYWPAGWTPYELDAPAQARPPVVNFAVGSSTNGVAFLGSQDGRVHAVNAESGALEWDEPIATMVQAAPAGNFRGFDLTALDFVLVGTRNSSTANALVALDVNTGAPQWSFDNSFPQNGNGLGIGIISSTAAVDYTNKLVYFASRVRAGGSADTVWSVDFAADPPRLVWSTPVGNVDGSPILFRGFLLVGTNSGNLLAMDTSNGDVAYSIPLLNGAVKGFVFPHHGTQNVFLSTNDKIWSVNVITASVNPDWPVGSVSSPSTPVAIPGGDVLSGGGDGHLHQLDPLTPLAAASTSLGDGTAAVGMPTVDVLNSMAYVGTDQGVIYGVLLPIP